MTARLTRCAFLFVAAILFAGCASPGPDKNASDIIILRGDKTTAYGIGGQPQLFANMGDHQRKVSTDSALAQQYFDQGLNWLYGFNHDEAVRSFTRAAQLDPSCAMAWWGVAYAQGPNYNDGQMVPARAASAWQAIQNAISQLDNESPAERELIEATAKRYADPGDETKKTQAQLKADFADAMAKVWSSYPSDADIGVLYADAMMLKNPWRLFKSDGSPARDETLTIIQTLEDVLALSPMHPGANHLYIHAVEAGKDKMRGVPAADRLSTLVPRSGHLTHMPSHIYVQAGLWGRAVNQNLHAIRTDEQYLERSPAQYRQHGYIAHNGHMLAFAAMMVGREEDAMRGALHAWASIPQDLFDTMGKRYDRALCAKFDVLKRFGRWDAILAEPAPPQELAQTTAVWRTCRAVAFAAKKDFDNAAIEQVAFRELLAKKPKDSFLRLNDLFISAEIALHKEQWDESIHLLEEAVAIEDTLGYGEPPRWLQPIRHTLGAVLHTAGRHADAERIYREDLAKWPGNGWSLFGLAKSLENQGKTQQAKEAFASFDQAWTHADNPLRTSCKCIPIL